MEIDWAMVICDLRLCIKFVLLYVFIVDCGVELFRQFETVSRCSGIGFRNIVTGDLHLVHNRFVILKFFGWEIWKKQRKCSRGRGNNFLFRFFFTEIIVSIQERTFKFNFAVVFLLMKLSYIEMIAFHCSDFVVILICAVAIGNSIGSYCFNVLIITPIFKT